MNKLKYILLIVLSTFISTISAFVGTYEPNVLQTAPGTPGTNDTLTFSFVIERSIFYRYRINRYKIYNHPEIERLAKSIEQYREDIKAGRAFVKVEGWCSGSAAIAKIRSNHVKSEMILNSGLKESHFYTVNHADVAGPPTDIVVVTVPVWLTELPPKKEKTGGDAPQQRQSVRKVEGIITDESGQLLNGVSVYAKYPATETSSDGKGRFTLAVPQDFRDQYVYFTSNGYTTDSVWLTGTDSLLRIRLHAAPVQEKPMRNVTGKIIDENSQPLGEVNIYTKNPMRGTSSNSEGRFTFTFPQDFQEQYLYFSSIGNKTDSVWLTGTDTLLLIQMKKDIQPTAALTDTDSTSLTVNDTTATQPRPKLNTKTLMNRAYGHILENYPDRPAHYDVFYRETNKTTDGKYVAVAEAMLDVYRDSYDNPKNNGQVRIEKSRKSIIPLYDSIVYMHFYGGAFAFIAKDHVLVRSKVIDPNHYGDFKFTQEEMTRFDGRDVYVVRFSDQKNDIHGKLYIEADNYAYIRIEVNTTRTIQGDGLDRSLISETVQYIPHNDGKWHLNQIRYTDQKKIYSTGMVFDNSIEHVTVQIHTENIAPIPKKQRLAYHDPFYMMAENYHPDYWDGYNVLQQDSALRQTLESLHKSEDIDQVMTAGFDKAEVDELMEKVRANQEKNLIVLKHDAKTNRMKKQFDWKQFHKKLYGGAGIHYQGVTAVRGDYAFDYPVAGSSLSFSQSRKAQKLPYGLDLLLGVHLTEQWSVYWMGAGNPLAKQLKVANHQIGAEYRFGLKEGMPLYLGFSAAFGWERYYADFGTIDNHLGAFNVEGKTIDATRLNIRGGIKQTALSPGVSLTGKINEIFEIELYAKYHQRVTQQTVNRIREKDGFFLARKQTTVGADFLKVTQDNGTTQLNKYISVVPFRVGVLLRFR
ncbi:MAG: carboxypeptidase-like regulatory domain-containing protein [Bacteroidales bacterium]|jgi:hypothetical protein|nr:carboxypeptidase-like regulatory domain-containing protein [Bacteroidales bacterium]